MQTARLILILPFLTLAACDGAGLPGVNTPPPRTPAQTVAVTGTDAAAAAAAEAQTGVAAGGLPVAALDRTAVAATSGRLGTTIASLGDATQQGFWIKTPLVRSISKGRIVNPATGKSANVDLIPLSGPVSAGSQVSLPAMQSIGAGLTDLPEIEVWKL